MTPSPTVGSYHNLAWRWLILLSSLLTIYCGAGRPFLTFPVTALAFLLVTPWSQSILRFRGTLVGVCAAWILLSTVTNVGRIVDAADLAAAMIEVVASILPVTLAFRGRVMSYWLALLSTSLIVIGSLLFRGDLVAYGILLLYLLCTVFVLNASHLFFVTRHHREFREPLPPRFFRQFFAVIPAGILCGTLVFLAFPRVRTLGASFGLRAERNATGYRGDISLSGGREIAEDLAIAFSVEMAEKDWLAVNGHSLYFRGNILSRFDGTNWKPELTQRLPYRPGEHRINVNHPDKMFNARIYREPNGHQTIFYPETLLFLQPRTERVGAISHNGYGSVFRQTHDYRRYLYDVGFAMRRSLAEDKATLREHIDRAKNDVTTEPAPFQLSEDLHALFLQIPEDYGDGSFFSTWSDSLNIGQDLTASEAVEALIAYFDANFIASLINQFSAADSFESFLTRDRRGHCEYFATATALFFRRLGVPSRVVVGYRGGTYNPVAEILEVREQNAHAWVEIFLPGSGWHTVDTTPPGPPTAESMITAQLRMYFSAFQFWFGRYVVNYNRETQRDLFVTVGRFKRFSKTGIDWKAVKNVVPGAAAFATVTGVLLLFWYRHKARNRFAAVPPYYRVFLSRVAAAGWHRERGESLRHFHMRLVKNGADEASLNRLLQIVERDLYAPQHTSQQEHDEARQIASLFNSVKSG